MGVLARSFGLVLVTLLLLDLPACGAQQLRSKQTLDDEVLNTEGWAAGEVCNPNGPVDPPILCGLLLSHSASLLLRAHRGEYRTMAGLSELKGAATQHRGS